MKKSFITSGLASINTCSLVSVNCSRQFSVKQLKVEIYIILCQYSITVFFRVQKIKINLVKLTFPTAISSNQVMGTSWLCNNYTMFCPPVHVRGGNPRASDSCC